MVLAAVHPGEFLREEFMLPLGLTAGEISRAIHVPRTRIERLVNEQVDLSTDTALRLARLFGTSAQFWMGIQSRYALETAATTLADDLRAITPLAMPAQ